MFKGHLDYFKNHLLEVGLTQNQETMTFRTLTTHIQSMDISSVFTSPLNWKCQKLQTTSQSEYHSTFTTSALIKLLFRKHQNDWELYF